MSGFTYIAIWPIDDIDRPRSALIAEACLYLDAMAADEGARLVGEPIWTVAEEKLVCQAPARQLLATEHRPHMPLGRRTPDHVIAEIQRLAGIGLTDTDIAAVVGADRKTVARYRREGEAS